MTPAPMLLMGQQRVVLAGTLLVFALAVPWSAGCGKTEAKADGGDGSLTIPDGTVSGRLAFDVTAVLRGDGSTNLPPTNTFTLVLDTDRQLAIVGGNGRAAVIGVTTTDGRTFHSAGQFIAGGEGSSCTGTSGVHYDNFEVTVAGGSLTGTASGSAEISCGDCAFFVSFGASLTGTVDATPPKLRGSGVTPSTPFDPLNLVVSEPLPVGATARLVADDGAAVDLVPTIIDGVEPLVVGFSKPEVVLRAGRGYEVPVDGLVDFAGQTDRTGPPLRLVSFPAAAAVPEDGFESATGSTLGGAMVMTGGALPAISGNTSLYIGHRGAPGLDTANGRDLTVRLARQASDTKLRLSYRVIADRAQSGFSGTVRVGTEGGPIGTAVYPFGAGTIATEPITVAGKQAFAGPVSTTETALPADAGSEVLVVIAPSSTFCGGPLLFVGAGLLIDDLRLE